MAWMGILDRHPTDAERDALNDEPRPGVWIQQLPNTEIGPGDGRELTQSETDALIACEIRSGMAGKLNVAEYDDLIGILQRFAPQGGMLTMERHDTADIDQRMAYQQRGGIHSFPLLRLLAFRLWGERDRAWGPDASQPVRRPTEARPS